MTRVGTAMLAMGVATLISRAASAAFPPEQVHLAFGLSPKEMRVAWSTYDDPAAVRNATVWWGESPSGLTQSAAGETTRFAADPGREWSIHTAEMTGLRPGGRYFYRVGDTAHGVSTVFSFTANLPGDGDGPLDSPQLHVIYGDQGAAHAYSLCYECGASLSCEDCANRTRGVVSEVARGAAMVLHVGDFAYDLDEGNGTTGDQYMRNIEQVAARVPYMVSHGNHERAQRFAHYTERFRHMPSLTGSVTTDNGEAPNNWFYSFDAGLVHYAAVSTEIGSDFPLMLPRMLLWLREDLKSVNRSETPWVVVHGHRSMYCSCDGDCDAGALYLRLQLESLFFEHGVDLFINGHEHDYERMYEIHRGKTTQSTVDMRATTYIVTGAAGSRELHEPFTRPQPRWSALRANTFGYSRMTVHNSTHLHWQQVATQKDSPGDMAKYGDVIDDVWLVQHHHGSFSRHQKFWDDYDEPDVGTRKSKTIDFRTGNIYTAAEEPEQYFAEMKGVFSEFDCVTGVCH